MPAFTATFQDGLTISLKNSRRDHRAAWRYTVRKPDGSTFQGTGWARDHALAQATGTKEGRQACNTSYNERRRRWTHTPGYELIGVEVVDAIAGAGSLTS